jgi:hypothetical protein
VKHYNNLMLRCKKTGSIEILFRRNAVISMKGRVRPYKCSSRTQNRPTLSIGATTDAAGGVKGERPQARRSDAFCSGEDENARRHSRCVGKEAYNKPLEVKQIGPAQRIGY